MARDNLKHRDCRGESFGPSGSAKRARHLIFVLHTELWNVHASDLSDVSADYLEAVQENGWPAEWVWFPATDHRIAYIGRTIVGEVSYGSSGGSPEQLELPGTR